MDNKLSVYLINTQSVCYKGVLRNLEIGDRQIFCILKPQIHKKKTNKVIDGEDLFCLYNIYVLTISNYANKEYGI